MSDVETLPLSEVVKRPYLKVWPEAGPMLGYHSETAAYRAANEWLDSDGERGLPCRRSGPRKLIVPVPMLLRELGLNGELLASLGLAPRTEEDTPDASDVEGVVEIASAARASAGPHDER